MATGCSALAVLSARAASGELAALQAQPQALHLCLPGITSILSSALIHLSHPPKTEPSSPTDSHSTGALILTQSQTTAAQQWVAVVKVLSEILPREQLGKDITPLIVQSFALQHSTGATRLCAGLLHHMPALFDKLGLDKYLAHFHPSIMHLIVAPDQASATTSARSSSQAASATQAEIAASFERAQLTNAASTAMCGIASIKLTLPVVLEHVVRPLLMALGNSPDVAVALIGVGSAIGGGMAAVHLLPSLAMVLISSRTVSPTADPNQASSSGKAPLPLHLLLTLSVLFIPSRTAVSP